MPYVPSLKTFSEIPRDIAIAKKALLTLVEEHPIEATVAAVALGVFALFSFEYVPFVGPIIGMVLGIDLLILSSVLIQKMDRIMDAFMNANFSSTILVQTGMDIAGKIQKGAKDAE